MENYLVHHGILGMKWGVRRFQNADGSLTAEGRQRYLDSNGELNREGKIHNKKALYGAKDYELIETQGIKDSISSYKEAFKQWGNVVDAQEELYEKLYADKSIQQKAEQMALKDGIKKTDPNFKYYVYGDTPSENYMMDAIYKDPRYKKLESEFYKVDKELRKHEKAISEKTIGEIGDYELRDKIIKQYEDRAKNVVDDNWLETLDADIRKLNEDTSKKYGKGTPKQQDEYSKRKEEIHDEAARKQGYTQDYINYVKQQVGGFNMVDDKELMDLVEQQYEQQYKKKARG